jgi:Na+/proline symporter
VSSILVGGAAAINSLTGMSSERIFPLSSHRSCPLTNALSRQSTRHSGSFLSRLPPSEYTSSRMRCCLARLTALSLPAFSTLRGGLRATLLTDYVHTVVIFVIVLVFFFKVSFVFLPRCPFVDPHLTPTSCNFSKDLRHLRAHRKSRKDV